MKIVHQLIALQSLSLSVRLTQNISKCINVSSP